MVPEYKKAATMLKAQGVRVAAIDCDANKGVAQDFGVKGFPAVKFIYKGRAWDYAGERKAAGIVTFAQTNAAMAKVKAGVGKVLGASKAAMSKVLGGGGAKAVAPVAAAA